MGNDLNTSLGLTLPYDVLKADMSGKTKLALIADFDRVLSLSLIPEKTGDDEEDGELTAYVERMIAERAEAKKAKNWARADEIRNELAQKGITLKDSKEGTTWTKA